MPFHFLLSNDIDKSSIEIVIWHKQQLHDRLRLPSLILTVGPQNVCYMLSCGCNYFRSFSLFRFVGIYKGTVNEMLLLKPYN